jgi:hypothetical protein
MDVDEAWRHPAAVGIDAPLRPLPAIDHFASPELEASAPLRSEHRYDHAPRAMR